MKAILSVPKMLSLNPPGNQDKKCDMASSSTTSLLDIKCPKTAAMDLEETECY